MGISLESLQHWAQTVLPILLDATVKGAVLLVTAAAVVTALRKKSAAARQAVWLLALAALLALPLASALLPAWQVLPGWAKMEIPSPSQDTSPVAAGPAVWRSAGV